MLTGFYEVTAPSVTTPLPALLAAQNIPLPATTASVLFIPSGAVYWAWNGPASVASAPMLSPWGIFETNPDSLANVQIFGSGTFSIYFNDRR